MLLFFNKLNIKWVHPLAYRFSAFACVKTTTTRANMPIDKNQRGLRLLYPAKDMKKEVFSSAILPVRRRSKI